MKLCIRVYVANTAHPEDLKKRLSEAMSFIRFDQTEGIFTNHPHGYGKWEILKDNEEI